VTSIASENVRTKVPVFKLRAKDDNWGCVESEVKSEGRMDNWIRGFPLTSVKLELVRNNMQSERLVHTCGSALIPFRTDVAKVTTIRVKEFAVDETLLFERG